MTYISHFKRPVQNYAQLLLELGTILYWAMDFLLSNCQLLSTGVRHSFALSYRFSPFKLLVAFQYWSWYSFVLSYRYSPFKWLAAIQLTSICTHYYSCEMCYYKTLKPLYQKQLLTWTDCCWIPIVPIPVLFLFRSRSVPVAPRSVH